MTSFIYDYYDYDFSNITQLISLSIFIMVFVRSYFAIIIEFISYLFITLDFEEDLEV